MAAQFRPEKDHALQLRAFALARQRAASSAVWSGSSEAVLAARLKLIGSCRNAGDERRVEQLVRPLGALATHLCIFCHSEVDSHQVMSSGIPGPAQGHEAEHLGIAHCVDFCVNVPYAEVRQLLGGAVGGLHTMLDEHFGISIVEYMAAGLCPSCRTTTDVRSMDLHCFQLLRVS